MTDPSPTPLRPLLDPVPPDLAAWFASVPDLAPPAAELEAPLLDPAVAAARTAEVARGVCGWAETQVVEELNAVLLAGNGSDSYIYLPTLPYPGAVGWLCHDDSDTVAFRSPASFAEGLRRADAAATEAEEAEDYYDSDEFVELRDFHAVPSAPAPDQPALNAKIADLLDRFIAGNEELERPLCLLVAGSDFADRPLFERMVADGGWYMLEAAADAIVRRPSADVRWLAKALAGYGHTNVSLPGERALAACDAAGGSPA